MDSKLSTTTGEWEQALGGDIRTERLAQRLSQAELARRANISLSAVKYLEGGKGSTLSTLIRVARALGRSEWLASFSSPQPRVSPIEMLRQRQAQPAPTRVRRRGGRVPTGSGTETS